MNRTVVYPAAPASGARVAVSSDDADKWGDKLVKYIPAEVVAFYLPMYAIVESKPEWASWLVFVLGVVGTLGYLFVRADAAKPPRFYFYVLSVVAFIAWASGTSSIATRLWGMPEWLREVTILAAVFLIPFIDVAITRAGITRRLYKV